MAKSKKFRLGHTGTILTAIKRQSPNQNITWYVGTPVRMFELNPFSISQLRRVCVLYGIDDVSLTQFIEKTNQHPNEHQFMTL